jgi:protein-tyrosine phosphatase
MYTDYHCHFLPGMDDGPGDVKTSLLMMNMWIEQGVERLAATPHYYPHSEPIKSFLSRREAALQEIGRYAPRPIILPGAEVRIERDICEASEITELTIAGSRYLLLEFPYAPLKEWMLSEVCDLAYNLQIIPVFAHIDRYLNWYSADDINRVLSIQGAVYQINNEALFKRETRRFALQLIDNGCPVVFVSDAHNMGRRPPNNRAALKILRSKLSKAEFDKLTEFNEQLI